MGSCVHTSLGCQNVCICGVVTYVCVRGFSVRVCLAVYAVGCVCVCVKREGENNLKEYWLT